MIITEHQYNTVIDGLRTQLELLRAKNLETFEQLRTARELKELIKKDLHDCELLNQGNVETFRRIRQSALKFNNSLSNKFKVKFQEQVLDEIPNL